MSILDLDKPSITFDKTATPYQNFDKLLTKFKGLFTLKNGDIELASKILIIQSPVSTKTLYTLTFGKGREMMMFPFQTFLYDDKSMYISNIHNYSMWADDKQKNVSGTQIVETLIKFAKFSGVNRLTLSDGASVPCGNIQITLSHYKLIEKGRTFYEKFGFKPVITNNILKIFVGSDEELQKKIKELTDDFHKIETKRMIHAYSELNKMINTIIMNQDYNKVDLLIYDNIDPSHVPLQANRSNLLKMLDDFDFILLKLKATTKKYLYEVLLDIYAENCKSYDDMMGALVYNMVYSITINDKTIKLKHIENMANLFWLLNRSSFQLDL